MMLVASRTLLQEMIDHKSQEGEFVGQSMLSKQGRLVREAQSYRTYYCLSKATTLAGVLS